MQPVTRTLAETFTDDVSRDIAYLERAGAEAAMTQETTGIAQIESRFVQAWRNLVEASSLSHAIGVTAGEVQGLADESGHFSRQEKAIIAARLSGLAEAAGQAGL